jgi:hypothetical protein
VPFRYYSIHPRLFFLLPYTQRLPSHRRILPHSRFFSEPDQSTSQARLITSVNIPGHQGISLPRRHSLHLTIVSSKRSNLPSSSYPLAFTLLAADRAQPAFSFRDLICPIHSQPRTTKARTRSVGLQSTRPPWTCLPNTTLTNRPFALTRRRATPLICRAQSRRRQSAINNLTSQPIIRTMQQRQPT